MLMYGSTDGDVRGRACRSESQPHPAHGAREVPPRLGRQHQGGHRVPVHQRQARRSREQPGNVRADSQMRRCHGPHPQQSIHRPPSRCGLLQAIALGHRASERPAREDGGNLKYHQGKGPTQSSFCRDLHLQVVHMHQPCQSESANSPLRRNGSAKAPDANI